MEPNYWTGSNEELNQALTRLGSNYRVPTQGATNLEGGQWSAGQPLVQGRSFGGQYGTQNQAAMAAGDYSIPTSTDQQAKKSNGGGMGGMLGGALSKLTGGGGEQQSAPPPQTASPSVNVEMQQDAAEKQASSQRLGKIAQIVGMFFGA